MELNAEQCIKELKDQTRYAKFIGSEGVLLSAKCATFVLEHAQYCEARIEELTEENKRLKQTRYKVDLDGRIEMIPTIQSVKADTVRKMQERLHARKVSYGNITFRVVPIDDIDQIAKEMLEGENG